jgi:DNA-binding NarL/FixJ family response regulator
VSVAIVEDEREVREAIANYLTSHTGFDCIASVESAEMLLDMLRHGTFPHVVLMDIGLPGMSGINAIKLIKERHPEIDIVMLTVYHDSHKIFDSLCAGASGYLLKTTPFSEIAEAITVVHAGGSTMSPQIARKVIEHLRPSGQEGADNVLTVREREVVDGLVEGLSYKMIAQTLGVTIETVRSHIKSIYLKLHVHSKAEVIGKSLKGEL